MNDSKIELLSKNKFIKKYIDGRLSISDLRTIYNQDPKLLLVEGITYSELEEMFYLKNEKIFNSFKYFREQSDIERLGSFNRFVRFTKKLKLNIAKPEDKVAAIKNMSVNKFLDLLSISRGLLYGEFKFKRYDKDMPTAVVGDKEISGDYEIEPPKNSKKEFEKFFFLMQKNINTNNLTEWAIKLYIAIIFAHIFPDGNGRLARNSYIILRSNPVREKPGSRERVRDICGWISERALTHMILKEFNIKISDDKVDLIDIVYKNLLSFRTTHQEFGLRGVILYFIAAVRVLERKGIKKTDILGYKLETIKDKKDLKSIEINTNSWNKNDIDELEKQYEILLTEFYWNVIEAAGLYGGGLREALDEALL